MDWLKQILKNAKVEDGQLNVEELLSAINKEFPKHAVPKETFNNTNEQLKTANKTIDDLKKNNKDNGELQKTIEAHKETIKTMEKQHSEELRNIKVDTAINGLLSTNKAKYTDLLLSKFDKSKIIVNDDGSITGLEEQFNGIKENYADLFEIVTDVNKSNDGNNGSAVSNTNNSTYTYTPKGGSEGGQDLAAIALSAVQGI
ncbi:phage scaffolding protein [Clostridium sp.]|uniref:phage scaffolding protein n=1 Tax=Clostridium sp. TaxID=1506 RepID=UPI003992D6E1